MTKEAVWRDETGCLTFSMSGQTTPEQIELVNRVGRAIGLDGFFDALVGWWRGKDGPVDIPILRAIVCAYEMGLASAPTQPKLPEPANYPVIPDGWRLVPVEPTTEMGLAYFDAAKNTSPLHGPCFSFAGYRAMLDAAPTQPPSPQPERAKGELLLAAESRLRKFIDAAAGDGLECGGIDAGDLYCGIWGFDPVPAQENDE